MKKFAALLLLATALATPAMAREVKINVDLVNYSGRAAYLAVYLTKADGNFEKTLWLAGSKPRYLGDLRGWLMAASSAGTIQIDGVTGASVGGGQTLAISADLADSMIDAGYTIHVETAVEDQGRYPDDATLQVVSTGGSAAGTGYVKTLTVSL